METGRYSETAYTLIMENKLRDVKNIFRSAYCREDFEDILEDLDTAKRNSAYMSRMSELKTMLRDVGIDCNPETSMDEVKKAVAAISSRDDVERMIFDELYNIYKMFPSSVDYMARLVRRLAPEYRNDTVRLAIVKKFIKNTDYNTDGIKKAVIAENGGTDIKKDSEKTAFVLEHITDDIFSNIQTEFTNSEKLKMIIGAISPQILDRINTDTKKRIIDFLGDADLKSDDVSELLNTLAVKLVKSDETVAGALISDIENQALALMKFNKRDVIDLMLTKLNAEKLAGVDAKCCSELNERVCAFTGTEPRNYNNVSELLCFVRDNFDKIPYSTETDEIIENLVEQAEAAVLVQINDNAKKKAKEIDDRLSGITVKGKDLKDLKKQCSDEKKAMKQAHSSEMKQYEAAKKELKKEYRTKYSKMRDSYSEKKKDKKKQKLKQFRLLKLADDLATGKFRTNGKTKMDLYAFAIAFGMTYSADRENDDYDPERDIEKNLFHDYYNDNLLRYISGDYTSNSSDYEAEPTGEGINYKNFAEVIYLYYIHREDMRPGEKLERANALIDRCVQNANDEGGAKNIDALEDWTSLFKDNFVERMLNLDETELEEYILENYYIPSNEELKSRSKITAASEEHRAYDNYCYILDSMKDMNSVNQLEEMDYGIDIDDFEYENIDDSSFTDVLRRLDDMLYPRKRGRGIFEVNDNERVTRTDLIRVFYYYYHMDVISAGEMLSLPALYDDFCDRINQYLEEARYQKISEKNIFDMFVIFSLYRLEII